MNNDACILLGTWCNTLKCLLNVSLKNKKQGEDSFDTDMKPGMTAATGPKAR